MTENDLVQFILTICLQFQSEAGKINCFDKMVNCAIVENGKILKKEEILNKCMKRL